MTSHNPIFQAPEQPSSRAYTVLGRDDAELRIRGRLLAHGTSQRDDHSHSVNVNIPPDHPGRYADKNERCSACRWFELAIYEVEADLLPPGTCTCAGGGVASLGAHERHCGAEPPSARYLVATAGRTIVPGEVNFRRAEYTDSPFEVVELLVQHRGGPGDHSVSGGQRFIPQTSARALAQAAAYDPELREAYLSFQRRAA